MQKTLTIKKMALCALFTALIAVGAFVKIPVPVIPLTLQTMFVILAGFLIGSKLGGLSALLYMILGLIGIPIFTSGSGIGYIFKPTFGYIIGFCFAAYVVGKITYASDKPITLGRMFAAMFAGLGIIYGFGLVYFYFIQNFVNGITMSAAKVLTIGFVATVPGDLITCSLACIAANKILPHIKKYLS